MTFPPPGVPARRPALVALTLVERAGSVLLVRHSYGQGLWGFPGGFVEPDETTEEAAAREVFEETGLVVEIDGVVAIADRGRLMLVVERGIEMSGALRAQASEIDEVRWFPLAELDAIADRAFGIVGELGRIIAERGAVTPFEKLQSTGPDGSHTVHIVGSPAPEPSGRAAH